MKNKNVESLEISETFKKYGYDIINYKKLIKLLNTYYDVNSIDSILCDKILKLLEKKGYIRKNNMFDYIQAAREQLTNEEIIKNINLKNNYYDIENITDIKSVFIKNNDYYEIFARNDEETDNIESVETLSGDDSVISKKYEENKTYIMVKTTDNVWITLYYRNNILEYKNICIRNIKPDVIENILSFISDSNDALKVFHSYMEDAYKKEKEIIDESTLNKCNSLSNNSFIPLFSKKIIYRTYLEKCCDESNPFITYEDCKNAISKSICSDLSSERSVFTNHLDENNKFREYEKTIYRYMSINKERKVFSNDDMLVGIIATSFDYCILKIQIKFKNSNWITIYHLEDAETKKCIKNISSEIINAIFKLIKKDSNSLDTFDRYLYRAKIDYPCIDKKTKTKKLK